MKHVVKQYNVALPALQQWYKFGQTTCGAQILQAERIRFAPYFFQYARIFVHCIHHAIRPHQPRGRNTEFSGTAAEINHKITFFDAYYP
jgi:hypothetical protein